MMKVEDVLPDELLAILDSPEFDDEAGIVIDAIKFEGDNLVLDFSFRYFDDGTSPKRWRLSVSQAKEEKILRDWTSDIALYKQHPRLLEYTDISTELYFNGTTNDADKLYISLHESLLALTGDSNLLEKYLPTLTETRTLSQQGYGLFARGPRTVLLLYQQCLIDFGIHSYFIGEYKPSSVPSSLRLFTLGSSYVIGREFNFEQLKG